MNEVHVPRSGCWRSVSCKQGIVITCFVCRNYDEILMKAGKLFTNIRVKENWLVSGDDRMFKLSDSAFKHKSSLVNLHRKSVEIDILFLGPSPGIRFTMRKVPSLSGLCVKDLSFLFRTVLRSPGTYWNSEPEHVHVKGFQERLWKWVCCRLAM